MKKICFIAQFPPPVHGLSKAVDTLFNSELNFKINPNGKYIFEKVNITNNRNFLSNLHYIKKSDADLFYFTISQSRYGNLRDLIILKALTKKNKKCLIHLHGGKHYRELVDQRMPSWQRKANYKEISKLCGVIVLSKSLKTVFEGLIDENKIHIVGNCVDDTYLLSEDEIKLKIEALHDKRIIHILWLSNFIQSKGYKEVLKLAKLESKRITRGEEQRFCFDFAGAFFDKKEKKFFTEYVKENHLEKIITFHGICVGDKKKELLKMCDIFALPTRYPLEGQPISILEAMGSGMYIITTNHAGIPDIVTETNGIVIYGQVDSEKIYKQMLKITNEDIINTENINRNFICDNYIEKNYISNMDDVFGELLTQ